MTIEDRLRALAESTVHPELESIESDVFARIDANARTGRQARLGLVAIIGSATLAGVASAAVPLPGRANATVDMVSTRLAPSTLLGGR
jgi:hypothetical protein